MSDVADNDEFAHESICNAIIKGVNANLETEYSNRGFIDDVKYCLENGFAVMSRSTTGLSTWNNSYGTQMIDNDRIIVHAHGSNNFEELAFVRSVGSIVSVRDVDGSYGAVEFTITQACAEAKSTWREQPYDCESWVTPIVAGALADYGVRYPTLTYTQIRQAMRDTASGGGVWQEVTGYGTPDWDACELALQALES